jgi:hypothetical protein
MRFNFDWAGFASGVVVEAAPAVVFGFDDKATLDRVAVDVLHLFDVFLNAGNVEVVIAPLPKLLLVGGSSQFTDEELEKIIVDALKKEERERKKGHVSNAD